MDESGTGEMSPSQARLEKQQATRKFGGAYDDVLITTIGLSALCDEMRVQGFNRESLLTPVGLTTASLVDPTSRITYRQKIKFFQNLHRLTRDPCVGLRAGQRRRLQDLGVFGYALSSFSTLGAAICFGLSHSRLAGSILERNLRVDGDIAVIEAHDVFELLEILPLVVEFSFSTMHRVTSLAMERPFRSLRMKLPYPAPPYAALYSDLFRCSIEFDADVLEWHFDAAQLADPCPNASLLSERMCRDICERMLKSLESDEPAIVRAIRRQLFKHASSGNLPNVPELASRLNLSLRTFTRRLNEVGVNCQDVIDDVRSRLAKELLGNTGLSVDEVAARMGFSDASNFSRAFKRWSAETPAEYRKRVSWRDQFAGRVDRE